MSRSPASDICRVRGIGVADSERTSTLSLSWRRSSFCFTPKRCSSSTISRPRSLPRTSLREQPVRADQDVNLARTEALHGFLDLSRLAEPGDHLDVEGRVREALAKGAEVLLGEDRRRDEHHHLLAVGDRLVGRAEGDLGLAVAHVAADQAIHRPLRLHVRLDRVDRVHLVRRLPIREGRLELHLHLAVGREGVALPHLPLCVEVDQLARHRARGTPGSGLHVRPALAAQRREGGLVALGADVAADPRELVGRREDPVAAAVLELEVVAGHPGEGLRVEPREARDPVVLVHHEVAYPQLDRGRQAGARRDRGRGLAAVHQAPLWDDRQLQLRSQKPLPQACLCEAHARLLRGPVPEEGNVDAAQVEARSLRLAQALEGDHGPVAGACELLELPLRFPQRARRELGPLRPERMLLACVRSERESGPGLQRLCDINVEAPSVLLEDGRGHVLPVVVERCRDLLGGGDHDQRRCRDEIERRQEVGRIRVVVMLRRELSRRRQLDPLGLAERALGEHREAAHRVDLVPEQVDPDRLLLGRRVDVEDAATHRELAPLLDLVGPVVAGVGEQKRDVVEVDALPLVERQRLRPQLRVRNLLGEGDRAGHDHGGGIGHGVHRRDPQAGEVRGRIEVGLEGGPPRRVDVDRAR